MGYKECHLLGLNTLTPFQGVPSKETKKIFKIAFIDISGNYNQISTKLSGIIYLTME
jgi:hypothetical protein